jgi:hypothetical protein
MAQTPLLENWHTGGFIVSQAVGHRSVDRGVILAGQAAILQAGTVLGQITVGTATAVAAGAGGAGANTGNGTFGTITPGPLEKAGAYSLKMLTATTFSLTDPAGDALPNGATGVAYSNPEISFTLTAGGTAFVAGDGFTITAVAGSGAWTVYLPANTNGSGVPTGILYGAVDATTATVGAVNPHAAIVVRDVEVNASELLWDASLNAGAIAVALAQMANKGIIAR